MKKLLIATDFSANAKHAAEYGYNLAKQIKADIVLCNAVIVPAEIPQAGIIIWPLEEYDTLMKYSVDDLTLLKTGLQHKDTGDGFKPSIDMVNENGRVAEVINRIVDDEKIDLVIMGTHGDDGLGTFLLGNHCNNMINAATKPLLLIPAKAKIETVKKIAFASDFTNIVDDLAAIYALIPFARLLNAEILITHIYSKKNDTAKFREWLEDFLVELSNKADYPLIYYRLVKNADAENGLDWLCEHGDVDMLTMYHRQHNFFSSLLKRSNTQKMADHISIPLLVIPAKA